MQSEPSNDHEESAPPEQEGSQLRILVKARPPRADRVSNDTINLSPRAQRRMAMGRRSGY